MSMIVKNNLDATKVLNAVNRDSSQLEKSLEQIASGNKIRSANDDASSYGISARMKEQIRSLTQDTYNIQNGSAMFKVAEYGINTIIDELRNLKDLALGSANDGEDANRDRIAVQKSFDERIETINEIADRTSYGGKKLLDGTYSRYDKNSDSKIFSIETQPLRIHHGARANQAIKCYIEDMHTTSLRTGKLINDDGTFALADDLDRYKELGHVANDSDLNNQTDLQAAWLATVTAASNKSLNDIDVRDRHSANVAVRVLDGAIEYALGEAMSIGAYLQRLDFTNSNVSTATENIRAAESAIREVDMPQTIINHTKTNMMLQSNQTILAQANQHSSDVLNLLQ